MRRNTDLDSVWYKTTSNEEIFNRLWQAIRNINGKLDKLRDLTQNLENKLNGIQTKICLIKSPNFEIADVKYSVDQFHRCQSLTRGPKLGRSAIIIARRSNTNYLMITRAGPLLTYNQGCHESRF